ncbi:MAG: helix-turn-helix domain-containing protein [Clostridium fessum]
MGLTDKLDILMKERNISKADLARESGVPYTTIDGFYKGIRKCKTFNIKETLQLF